MTKSAPITAEQIVELFRRDARARRELAVLLVSEPEVRLAIVNAVLREVATKEDIEKLRRELREEFRRELEALRQYVDRRFERLEAEVRELNRRLWWVVGTLIVGWLAVVIEQLLLYLVAR